MTKAEFLNPHGIKAVRTELPAIVERLRQGGRQAQPLVFGRYNRPEAVLISAEQYLALAEYFDDLLDEPTLEERLSNAPADDDLELTTVEDFARTLFQDKKNE
ncbi:type II toxin-antitoxin system Phd/YefM family antitoxin [Nocardiopsis sp. NRRL B-16309]|uniref:type II toxin-antitoxin system Phd/YefM family antitoxin n=1 Tax=Nocardiopsis sp. NRRL B-16309 TaxID=1519494 RepID=UPI0006AE5BA3|nr:type II toxin-antitoxin system Phd/YefM family antitoxin [Nocardiopsis sp. NRRL B-16309]KOX13685.1 hypothetical protein ADL05_18545 [Nocardiopsis sp. NRRL B-16309]